MIRGAVSTARAAALMGMPWIQASTQVESEAGRRLRLVAGPSMSQVPAGGRRQAAGSRPQLQDVLASADFLAIFGRLSADPPGAQACSAQRFVVRSLAGAAFSLSTLLADSSRSPFAMPSRPSSNSETARLIQGAKEGDADAYDELFAQAFARLQLFLRLRIGADLRQREDSRDLLQEAYLKAHKAFGNFEDRGPGSFGRWLCHIAENCIRERVDYHRAAKRRPPADFARVSQVLERIEAGTLGPAQRAERAEQQARLVEAMADLPSDQREVMLKRHFEGLDLASIATALGISATSVRRLIGRATLRLGALLAETEGDES